jgi:hypothetical protein
MATDHVIQDRQSRRDKVIMSIRLVANPEGERVLVPATTLDFSSGGLRIQALVRLSIGEIIHVQFENESTDLRRYQVVWTKAAGGLQPSQAGLRCVKSAGKTIAWPLTLSSNEPGLKAA